MELPEEDMFGSGFRKKYLYIRNMITDLNIHESMEL
jgi:hypothetical protein